MWILSYRLSFTRFFITLLTSASAVSENKAKILIFNFYLNWGPLRLSSKLYNAWKLILVLCVTGGLSVCGGVQGALFQLNNRSLQLWSLTYQK